MAKAYVVEILIETAGYEKVAHHLITEVPEGADPFIMACALESHNKLEDTPDGISDGGDFIYTESNITEVMPEHLETVSQYLRPWMYDYDYAETIENLGCE